MQRSIDISRHLGGSMLGGWEYPTLWLPAGLIAAIMLSAVVSPWGRRRTRSLVAVVLAALVVAGYRYLPPMLDVDRVLADDCDSLMCRLARGEVDPILLVLPLLGFAVLSTLGGIRWQAGIRRPRRPARVPRRDDPLGDRTSSR
jgi:hypothetical protein